MNIITAFAAYCLYPLATLNRMLGLINGKRQIAADNAIYKYRRRGYRLVSGLARSSLRRDSSAYFNETQRCVGDGYTWSIPLDKDLLAPMDDIMQINTWELWFNRERQWEGQTSYCIVSSPFLRNRYLAADDVMVQTIQQAVESSHVVQGYVADSDSDNDSIFTASRSISSSASSTFSDTDSVEDVTTSIGFMSTELTERYVRVRFFMGFRV